MYIETMLTKDEAIKIRDLLSTSNDEELVQVSRGLAIQINRLWNPDIDQDALCNCSHPYHRHFDSYEDMYPIGCKYCGCDTFNDNQL